MKLSIYKMPVFMFLSLVTACAGTPERNIYPYRQPTTAPRSVATDRQRLAVRTEDGQQSLEVAVERLCERLAVDLNNLSDGQARTQQPGFYIYNRSFINHRERELDRRIIQDLIQSMVHRGFRIKRKDVVSWKKATTGISQVDCKEVLERTAPDYLIEYDLVECPSLPDCAEIRVQVLETGSNDILYMVSESFKLAGRTARWYHLRHALPPLRGSSENPYPDYYAAARGMAGRLCCMIRNQLNNVDEIRITPGKTDQTPQDVAMAFSDVLSSCFFPQVIGRDSRMLPVAIGMRDHFELSIYRRDYNEKLDTASIVMAVDEQDAGMGKVHIKAQVLTLKPVLIRSGKNVRRLSPGMVIPGCTAEGFSRKNYPSTRTYRSKADRHVRESATNAIEAPSSKPPETVKSYSPPSDVQSAHVKRVYERNLEVNRRKLSEYIRNKLRHDNISPRIVNMFSIGGELLPPDCRVEDHYLWPKDIPPRHVCEMSYNVVLIVNGNEWFTCKGLADGVATSDDLAWEQAIYQIGERTLYPLILDIALTLSEQITLRQLRNSLENLDTYTWRMEQDLGTVMNQIEQELDRLSQGS